ncbi:MAG: flagellar biosynthesis protein FliP [Acidimicrobiales bacterium]|nr:flagellar type III secretion system pore protein FliP [Hyphomonadaceae bacterium]RZV42877.1 MAG: flagellar biosynthesis protein FliP [Acidimicrobiales bacterium]
MNARSFQILVRTFAAVIVLFGLGIAGIDAVAQVPSGDDTAGLLEQLSGADGTPFSAEIIKLFIIVTVLSLSPGIAMMITCLPFMVIVFSFLRQAIGLQQSPPNMMIMALAMFLTFFVMEPVFTDAWDNGLTPFMDGEITETQAVERTLAPFKVFMQSRVEPETTQRLAATMPERGFNLEGETPFTLLVTAFMLSEIKHAFQIGFVIFLPFLIIDLIVASILMAMGMMMVPPAVVSLPFKLAFFVMADGWMKITEALLQGYGGV